MFDLQRLALSRRPGDSSDGSRVRNPAFLPDPSLGSLRQDRPRIRRSRMPQPAASPISGGPVRGGPPVAAGGHSPPTTAGSTRPSGTTPTHSPQRLRRRARDAGATPADDRAGLGHPDPAAGPGPAALLRRPADGHHRGSAWPAQPRASLGGLPTAGGGGGGPQVPGAGAGAGGISPELG